MIQSRTILLFLFICCSFLIVFSVKTDYSRTSSGFFADNVVNAFGMAVGGIITIDYNIQQENNSILTDSYVLILVVNERQRISWYNSLSPSTSQVDTLCAQPSTQRIVATGQGNWNITVDEGLGSNQYSVLAMQCRVDTGGPVSVKLHVEMKNIQPSGSGYSQLGIEKVTLVNLYGGEIIIYVLLLVGLLGQMYLSRGHATLSLHYLFLCTLVLYLLTTILNYLDYNVYNHDGEVNTGIDVSD